MIPVLYEKGETLFLSNGIGRLSDIVSCEVTEERNGVFECEFVYPVNGKYYREITEGRLIYCTHDEHRDPQPFEIYKRSAEIDGLVTFNAHHISYRLSNIIVTPFDAGDTSVGIALTYLEANAIGGCPFTLRTTKATSGKFAVNVPDSIRARLGGVEGSILDAFGGGEYKFDKFTVTLYETRGVDNGVSIRYGKNLTDIKAERSIEGRYTGVVPYWANDAGERVMLPELYILADAMPTNSALWTDENDTIIRDGNGSALEFDYFDISLAPMDLSEEWDEAPTVAQLRAKAQSKLSSSKAWETEENIEIDFVALWNTPEYEGYAALQRVGLCDVVSVYYPAFEVEQKKKVIKTVYDTLLDRYKSIELGMPQASFADVVRERTVSLLPNYVRQSGLQAAIDHASQLIQGGLGGYVVMKTNANGQPEEILIMDTDDINTAVNVIRMNKNGIGFSTTGYSGTYRTAWTIDGHFVADFIDTGTLSGSLIEAYSIAANKLRSKSITSLQIQAEAIDTDELAAGAVTSEKIYSGSVTTDKLDAKAVTAGKIDVSQLSAISANLGTITAGILRASAGGSSWNLNTGYFITDSGARSIRMYNGREYFYYGDTQTGYIAPFYWDNDNQQEGIVFLATEAKYLGIGKVGNSCLVINNGLNPGGNTDAMIFNVSSSPVDNGVQRLGSSSHRFYQIWTTSLNLAAGVYINYSSSTDRIYSSKTISQGSDEILKNIFPYDDKYDILLDVLKPILYTWKDRPDGSKYVGLGARKTAKQLEELGIEKSGFVGIGTDDKGAEVYGIDYSELSVMLLHKVQKQQKEIDTLKTQLADVLERLERLEAKNANT